MIFHLELCDDLSNMDTIENVYNEIFWGDRKKKNIGGKSQFEHAKRN